MRTSRSILIVVVWACALTVAAGTAFGAAERHPHVGRLPGFPAMRGVVPVLGSSAAVAQHEKLVDGAFAAARARHSSPAVHGVPNEEFFSECEEEVFYFSSQNVCYRGGPVLRDPTIHLIFWQGPIEEDVPPLGSHVELFPPHYIELVERYFTDLSHDNATASPVLANTFAVEPQYYDENEEGSAAVKFEVSPADVKVDNSSFPSHTAEECDDATAYSEGPCLLDSDLHAEVEKFAETETKGLGDLYVVLTPPGVGGCFEKSSGECAYKQYCAYHGDFGGDGVTPGDQTIYADLPYLGEVIGCDSGVHPNEAFSATQEKEAIEGGGLLDEGADAVIDTADHEVNEAISDPIGSQCESGATKASQCERNAWTDVIGQEIADKCLPPESTLDGSYGEPLGEVVPGRPAREYNQSIDGHPYWVQRVWSNEAGLAEGGCVQRGLEANFTISSAARATAPVTLDGLNSGAPNDPAIYWVWSILSTGEQFGAKSPTLVHAFAVPGLYVVGLTAYDQYGNSVATARLVEVGAAPPPMPPTPPTVVKEVIVPGHYSPAQVAVALGLPANGKKLSGFGPYALGKATCPPACGVTLQLYAKETKTVHKHRTSKLVLVGSAHLTVAAKASVALKLSLNAKGKALLRKASQGVAVKLIATVEGQEGGSWQITRLLTLTGSGKAARRARR